MADLPTHDQLAALVPDWMHRVGEAIRQRSLSSGLWPHYAEAAVAEYEKIRTEVAAGLHKPAEGASAEPAKPDEPTPPHA